MSGHGAYEDEMRLRRPYDTDDPEFSSLAEELRSACRGAPGPDVEARHIRAIVEQARLTPEAPIAEPNVVRRASKPVGVLARLGAAAVALAVLTGSLALAGVDLPVLPDRDSDTAGESREKTAEADAADGDENRGETALRVLAAIEANLPLLQAGDISGCEFGAIVSAAARGVEPDTSKCNGENAAEGDDAEPGPARSETAQRVQAAIEVNLPLLHEGEISGCEFGAIVSAAARGVEPDTSKCDTATVKAEADEAGSQGANKKSGAAAKSSAPKGSKTAGDSQGNKEGGGGDATGASEEPAAKANNKGNAKAKGKGTDEDKAPGLGKGNGAPPAGKPGGKFDGD